MDSYQIVRNRIESTKNVTYRLRLKQRSIVYEIMLSLILNDANVRKLEHPELAYEIGHDWWAKFINILEHKLSFTKRKRTIKLRKGHQWLQAPKDLMHISIFVLVVG